MSMSTDVRSMSTADKSHQNQRLTEFRAHLAETELDAALLFHHRDILYYAGTSRPAVLLVSPRGAILLVRRGLEFARQEATVARVEPMRGFTSVAQAAEELGLREGTHGSGSGALGTELDLVPAQLAQRLRDTFPGWSLADVSPLILAQRCVKDEAEIAATRGAAAIADAGHASVPQAARPGISELTLVAEVEAAIRRAGHEALQPLRYPGARGGGVFLMSGENLTVRGGHGLVITGRGLGPSTPYGPSRRPLHLGDLIVVDIGSAHQGYTADESRTFVVGPATDKQRALFAATRAAEDAVLAKLRAGAAPADLLAVAEAALAPGAPPDFAPGSLTLPGFVGHGIGLELDEPPVLWPRDETRLQAGMVLAIEIEVSAAEHRMMTKLEDTVVVRPDGYELLTTTPRELIECG